MFDVDQTFITQHFAFSYEQMLDRRFSHLRHEGLRERKKGNRSETESIFPQ